MFLAHTHDIRQRELLRMRLLIHDSLVIHFRRQLSRRLANAVTRLRHVYPVGLAGSKRSTYRCGVRFCRRLNIRGIQLSSQFRKYSAHRRFVTQRKYANDSRN